MCESSEQLNSCVCKSEKSGLGSGRVELVAAFLLEGFGLMLAHLFEVQFINPFCPF